MRHKAGNSEAHLWISKWWKYRDLANPFIFLWVVCYKYCHNGLIEDEIQHGWPGHEEVQEACAREVDVHQCVHRFLAFQ